MEFLFQNIFKSWKTTVIALVGALAWTLAQYGFELSPEQSQSIIVVAMLVIGIFAKDATVSHTQN